MAFVKETFEILSLILYDLKDILFYHVSSWRDLHVIINDFTTELPYNS